MRFFCPHRTADFGWLPSFEWLADFADFAGSFSPRFEKLADFADFADFDDFEGSQISRVI